MGIAPTDLPSIYDKVQTAVKGWHEGKGGVWDLRTIKKLETPRKIKDPSRIPVGDREAFQSIIKRQHHYKSEYVVYFSSEEESLDKIEESFEDPTYALSMGMSDELLRIKEIARIEMGKHEEGEFSHTVLLGSPEDLELTPLVDEGFEPPLKRELPTKFEYRRGYRRPAGKKTMTFISEGVFKAPVPCQKDEEYGYIHLH